MSAQRETKVGRAADALRARMPALRGAAWQTRQTAVSLGSQFQDSKFK